MKHAACYRESYPRPRFVRESFVSLDGDWQFAFDEAGDGQARGYHKGSPLPLTIRVPYAYNTPSSGLDLGRDVETVWYRRTFAWNKRRKKRVLLHLDGADYFCDVWLNGVYLGGHEGGYTRFTLDLTAAIKRNNVLSVRCRDPFDPAYPRGKQRHLAYNTGCFYAPTVGLWKPVWLEEVDETHLVDLVPFVKYGEAALELNYTVAAYAGARLTVTAAYEGRTVAVVSTQVTAPEGRVTLDLVDRGRQLPVKPWSAGQSGQFYDLTLTLERDGRTTDRVGSYAALVDYRIDRDRILIDYLPSTYLRMVLAQGYYPGGGMTATQQQLLEDVLLIKEMGFNGVRMHQKLEDERFYYFCDMAGLYVWCEMPSAYVTDERTIAAVTRTWQEAVTQYRGYLSVMAFVPFNESWGCLQVSENARQQAWVTALYWLTKALAPGRLVVCNDGWEHTETDLVTLHDYAQDPASLREAYADLGRFLAGGRVRDLSTRTAFAGRWAYKGQPVVVSEYGGVRSDPQDGGWGYGSAAADAGALAARLKGLTAAITANPGLAGYCLTQLYDVEQERNGLLKADRTPKLPIETIREINSL